MKLVSNQVSEQEVTVIMRELHRVLQSGIDGNVVEFGCYVGTTSLFLQDVLVKDGSSRLLHVYDSFQGLPDKVGEDNSPAGLQFQTGELTASREQLKQNFKKANLPQPIIHKAWFSDLLPRDIPSKISFAFLDGDYYYSILDPLKLIWPRLTSGATIVIDDYQNEQLPGVRKAVDVWRQHHSFEVVNEASLAIIRQSV